MSRATGYVFEAVAERRVVRDWPGGILIADREIRLCIARLVDLAEATCAGRREDVVGAESVAGGETHFFSAAVQFVTAVRGTIFVAGSPLGGTPIRKRWPSRD